jgi:hydrogenase-4 component E
MMDGLVRSLSLTLILTSFLTVESRSLRRAHLAYLAQAAVMVTIIGAFATVHPALWVWALTAFVTKLVLIGWLVGRAVGAGDGREVEPFVGELPSAAFIGALALIGWVFIHRNASFLAPTPLAEQEPYRTNVAVALTLMLIGVYAVLTRRDAIKVVLGVCLMENGAHLSLVTLANGLHETVLIGVATDVVLAVFLLLHLVSGIEARIGTRDTARLRELRW